MNESLQKKIAYLAPEIPALSATFVYEELKGLEARGCQILPISVRVPLQSATDQQDLAERVRYLYKGRAWKLLGAGLLGLPAFGRGALKALGWLLADVWQVGPLRLSSWKLIYQFLVAVTLARWMREGECTHLHIHFAHVPTQIGMYASAMTGVPFTVMAHANDIFERGLLLQTKAERAVKLLSISKHNSEYLKNIGVPVEKLALLRCGVSFQTSPPQRSFVTQASYRIGTLGRLVEKKGIDLLIRAVSVLKQSGYSVELSIVGDGPLREQLETLAAELGVAECIYFTGNMPHSEVAEWMRQLDIFVLPCKKDANGDMDGIPVVLMEAMSQSVPVISTRLSGIPELVVDEETGLLSEPDNVDDLVRQIKRLLDSNLLRESFALAGAKHVQEEFGQDVNLDRLLMLIK